MQSNWKNKFVSAYRKLQARAHMPCGQPRRRQRGFTLVELMYAVGYFTVGMTGVVCFQVVAAFGSQNAANLSVATNIASSTLEALRYQSQTAILAASQPVLITYDSSGGLITNASPANANLPYFTASSQSVMGSNTPMGNPARFLEVTVNVTWQQTPLDPWQHGILMQSRIGTD